MALEHDKAVLKCGVLAKHQRLEEMERAVAELKKKVVELETANYALSVRLRDADGCRFQAYRGRGSPMCFDCSRDFFGSLVSHMWVQNH